MVFVSFLWYPCYPVQSRLSTVGCTSNVIFEREYTGRRARVLCCVVCSHLLVISRFAQRGGAERKGMRGRTRTLATEMV